VRFHRERQGRVDVPLPFAQTPEHDAFVRRLYAEAQRRTAGASSPNPYALLPDTLGFLGLLLEEQKPSQVVEFGSGESTYVFAKGLAASGGRLVSVEHDRGWVGEVERRLTPETRAAVRMVHAPLRPSRRGARLFLSYSGLEGLRDEVAGAQLFLLDGPHMSGRELVLQFVLSNCPAGALVVVDDFRHYAVRDMLLGIPAAQAACFAGAGIDENAHGLFVLRCLRTPVAAQASPVSARAVAQSYWRCLRDFRQYGLGD
jgi:hypothetical protein